MDLQERDGEMTIPAWPNWCSAKSLCFASNFLRFCQSKQTQKKRVFKDGEDEMRDREPNLCVIESGSTAQENGN